MQYVWQVSDNRRGHPYCLLRRKIKFNS